MVQLDATSAKPSITKPPCQNRPSSVNHKTSQATALSQLRPAPMANSTGPASHRGLENLPGRGCESQRGGRCLTGFPPSFTSFPAPLPLVMIAPRRRKKGGRVSDLRQRSRSARRMPIPRGEMSAGGPTPRRCLTQLSEGVVLGMDQVGQIDPLPSGATSANSRGTGPIDVSSIWWPDHVAPGEGRDRGVWRARLPSCQRG